MILAASGADGTGDGPPSEEHSIGTPLLRGE